MRKNQKITLQDNAENHKQIESFVNAFINKSAIRFKGRPYKVITYYEATKTNERDFTFELESIYTYKLKPKRYWWIKIS
jgi:hypothetical protein